MKWRKLLGWLLCLLIPLPLAFLILCTFFAILDPENWSALIVFILADIGLVALFVLGIRLIVRCPEKKPLSGKFFRRCPECGGNVSTGKICPICQTELR